MKNNNPLIPSENKFDFSSINKNLELPKDPTIDELIDDDYQTMLNKHADMINKFAPQASSNSLLPANATDMFNPYEQNTGGSSDPNNTTFDVTNILKDKDYSDKTQSNNPVYSGFKTDNFDRFYAHPKFAKLGWTPYGNNEEKYNVNSNFWDDHSRMWGQFAGLFMTGVKSSYRSLKDLVDNDNYFSSPDLESAREFSDAVRIGSSSAGGLGQFTNNLLLQTGYTAGIISAIALEELALMKITALSGGTAAPLAAAKTIKNIERGVDAIVDSFDIARMANATRNMYKKLNDVDKAKDTYKLINTGGDFIGDLIAPQTMKTLRSFKSVENGADNLKNISKTVNTFGAFYRDLRSINLALAESKMEGGTTYDQQFANAYSYLYKKNKGVDLTDEQLKIAQDSAERAAFKTTMLNAPLIYLSNKLVLDTAFSYFNKRLSAQLGDYSSDIANRIVKKDKILDSSGKLIKNPYSKVDSGIKGYMQKLKSAGVEGTLKTGTHASLRYFAANLGEGIQEMAQEAISHGSKHYHQALLENPENGGYNLLESTISSAVNSQMNAKGFETFMTGFLMGGIVQGPQKVFFEYLPQALSSDYKSYKQAREKMIDAVVEAENKKYELVASDPLNTIWNTNKTNVIEQKTANDDLIVAMFQQSNIDGVDAKDYSKFQSIYAALANNSVEVHKEQYKNYLNLSDEELASAFNASKADIKSGKLRSRISDILDNIERLEKSYLENKDKFQNPFNPTAYEIGTRDRVNESISYLAYEHFRYLYMFTKDGFERAVERANSIYNSLASDPVISKMAASDITVLLNEKSIKSEITLLQTEIKNFDPKTDKKLIESKQAKFNALNEYYAALTNPSNQKKKGKGFDRRRLSKTLRPAFIKYINTLAKNSESFVDKDLALKTLGKIVDHISLSERALSYDKSIEALNNPGVFQNIFDRNKDYFKRTYQNRSNIFRKTVESYVDLLEINQLLNEFAKLNIYPHPADVEKFNETHDVDDLVNFYSDSGIVTVETDKDTFEKITELKRNYKNLTDQTDTTEAEKKGDITKVDPAEIEIDPNDPFNVLEPELEDAGKNPVIHEVIERKYKEHIAKNLAVSNHVAKNTWLQSEEGAKYFESYKKLKKEFLAHLRNNNKEAEAIDKYYNDEGFLQWLFDNSKKAIIQSILDKTNTRVADFTNNKIKRETAKQNNNVEDAVKNVSEPTVQDVESTNIEENEGIDFNDIFGNEKTEDQKSNVEEVTDQESIVEEPTVKEPITQETTVEEPVPQEVIVEETATQETTVEEEKITVAKKQITTETENGVETIEVYTVKVNGEEVTPEIYDQLNIENISGNFTSKNKAEKAARILKNSIVDTSNFTFGDYEVHYGLAVYDATGKKHIVVSEPNTTGNILLLSEDLISKAKTKADMLELASVYSEDTFNNNFNLDIFEYLEDNNKVPKLNPFEGTQLYSVKLGDESTAIRSQRWQATLNVMAPEIIKRLKVTISKNASRSNVRNFEKGGGENKNIKIIGEPISAALKITDTNDISIVKKALDEKGIDLFYDADGSAIIGFFKTGSLAFVDANGNLVSPANITKDIADKTVEYNGEHEFNAIKENFIAQSLLVQELNEKLGKDKSKTIDLTDLDSFDLKIYGGRIESTNKAIPSSQIKNNSLDGNKLIIINRKSYENGIPTYMTQEITDIEDVDEQAAFIEKHNNEILNNNPNLRSSLLTQQGYFLIVKQPNGVYTGIPLIASTMTSAEVKDLNKTILDAAYKTIEENLIGDVNGTYDIKDKLFTAVQNRKISERLYISSDILGLDISIIITNRGNIKMSIYDRVTEKVLDVAPIIYNKTLVDLKNAGKEIDIFNVLFNNYLPAELKKKKKKYKNTELEKILDLKLSSANIKNGFAKNASVEEILDKTATTINPDIRTNQILGIVPTTKGLKKLKKQSNVVDTALPPKSVAVKDKGNVAPPVNKKNLDTTPVKKEALQKNNTAQKKVSDLDPVINKEINSELLDEIEKLTGKQLRAAYSNDYLGKIDLYIKDLITNIKEDVKRKAKLDGLGMGKILKLIKINPEIARLESLKRKLAESTHANKIVSPSLSLKDVDNINAFTKWAAANLPEFIDIQDINTLEDNLLVNGVRIGAFALNMNSVSGGLNIGGTIYVGAKTSFKYHEAFHSVFRLLLTNEQQNKYLKIAYSELKKKYGDSLKTELEKFRNSWEGYSKMSDARLLQEFAEEYMADEFQKFKENPRSTKTSSTIKSFFNKLLEWLKAIFKRYHTSDLQDLFKNIDAGKFKSSGVASNQFTENYVDSISYANKIIPIRQYKHEKTGLYSYELLDTEIAKNLVSSITARVIDLVNTNTDPEATLNSLIEDVIIEFTVMYDINSDTENSEKNIEHYENLIGDDLALFDTIDNINVALTDYSNFIEDAVKQQLKFYDINELETLDKEETIDANLGSRVRLSSQYDKENSSIGGFKSLSKFIRQYIGTTKLESTDLFGNEYLVRPEVDKDGAKVQGTGVPLKVTVDFNSAYNGFLKAVKNLNDPIKILQQLYLFSENNKHTRAVVNRLFKDLGVTWKDQIEVGKLPQVNNEALEKIKNGETVELDELGGIKNPLLFQAIIKGFENSRIDYLFVHDTAGETLTYSAANRDDAVSQLQDWSNNSTQALKKLTNDKNLSELILNLDFLRAMLDPNKKVKDETINKKIIEIAEAIEKYTGILLSPNYLKYSILKSKEQNKLNESQLSFINLNSDAIEITLEDIDQLSILVQEENPDPFSMNGSKGMKSRLRKMAVNNALFDENVGASVFKNPNGDLVFAHQLPSYHIKKVNSFNNSKNLEDLKKDPFLTDNFLLNSLAFNQMSMENRLSIMRLSGSKSGVIEETDDLLVNDKGDGVTYGDFDGAQFIDTLLKVYRAHVNNKSGKVNTVEYLDGDNYKESALAPVLIRVLEASNTGDLISLPVFKAVELVKNSKGVTEAAITKQTLDAVYNNIKAEFDRIKRESNPDTRTKELIIGYNAKAEFDEVSGTAGNIVRVDSSSSEKDINKARAFKLHKTEVLLEDATGNSEERTLVDIITSEARKLENTDKSLDQILADNDISLDQFYNTLEDRLNLEFSRFQSKIENLGIITSQITDIEAFEKYSDKVEAKKALDLLNLVNDKDHNLKQIFLNDYVNTAAINQMLLGDVAISLKDAIDEIKRAKAQSASYYSAASVIASPVHGIMKPVQEFSLFAVSDPTAKSTHSNNTTDVADAQLWLTAKAFRNFTFGFGKLSNSLSSLLDKVEKGEELTAKELQKYAKAGEMINSKKYVYADGKTFVKMSAFTLLPQYTSEKDKDGNWTIPKPHRKHLHNLRIKLETYERENDTVTAAAPLSAIKMMKKNVSNIYDITNTDKPLSKNQETLLDANFLGLQTINPSNKAEITDPTQIKSLVTSEQNDNSIVILNGKPVKIGQIKKAYHAASSHRGDLSFVSKRNLIFDIDYAASLLDLSLSKNEITPDLYSYLQYAQASIGSTGTASHLMELFDTDENGDPKYNLNSQLTYKKFIDLFMSYFSKGVFREKIPGTQVSLVSDFGSGVIRKVFSVDSNGLPDKQEVIRESVFAQEYNKNSIALNIYDGSSPGNDSNLSNLGQLIKESNGQGVIIVDRLRHNLKEYDKNGNDTGQRYGEALLPAHHSDVLTNVKLNKKARMNNAFTKAFAVRIPSQDNHSTYNVKIVDFIPTAYGSSGIFAREIVETSGADFDIDKVFMQFKEFFYDGAEFKEYGDVSSLKEGYDHYIRYINEKVKKEGNVYNEAVKKKRPAQNSVTDAEKQKLKDDNLSNATIKALLTLSKPITFEEYKQYLEIFNQEPYEGAINNKILDYKYALMGNRHVTKRQPLYLLEISKNETDNKSVEIDGKYYAVTTQVTDKPYIKEGNDFQETAAPISYDPANLDALFDVVDYLKSNVPEILERTKETGADVDNLLWKTIMFENNKKGSKSIGAIVLPNVYLNLLGEHNVSIYESQIKINGITYSNFNADRELISKTKDGVYRTGYRSQYVISGLITAATDDAKEKLLAKLGLNINALAVAGTLTKLGVPLKSTILMLNNSWVYDLYETGFSSPTLISKSIDFLVAEIKKTEKTLKVINSSYSEKADENLKGVTDDMLVSLIKSNNYKSISDFRSKIEDKLENQSREKSYEILKEAVDELRNIVSVLNLFKESVSITNYAGKMKEIINLSADLGQGLDSIEKKQKAVKELMLDASDKQVKEAVTEGKIPFDARPAFSNKTLQGGFLKRFKQFSELLLPKIVLAANPNFIAIGNALIESSTNEFQDKHLLSYLSLKAYMHDLSKKEDKTLYKSLSSINTTMYYDNVEDNIVDLVNELRDDYSKYFNGFNHFLNYYLVSEKASSQTNITGMHTVGSNTFRKHSDSRKIDIQNGFMELYSNPYTRNKVMKLLFYMMSKNGLQYGYGSIVEAIAPIAITNFLDKMDNVEQVFNDPLNEDADAFKNTFGMTYNELMEEYASKYLESAYGAFSTKTLDKNKYIKVYDPNNLDGKEKPNVSDNFTKVVVLDKSNPASVKLTVDANRGEKISPVEGSYAVRKTRKLNSDKISEEREKMFDSFKSSFGKMSIGENTVFKFPYVIKTKIDNDNYMFFRLKHVQGPIKNNGNTLLHYKYNIPVGTYAEYEQFEVEGSKQQFPLGFMFGARPTNNQIKEYNKYKHYSGYNGFNEMFENFDNILEYEDLNFAEIFGQEPTEPVDFDNLSIEENDLNLDFDITQINESGSTIDFDQLPVSFDGKNLNVKNENIADLNIEDFENENFKLENVSEENEIDLSDIFGQFSNETQEAVDFNDKVIDESNKNRQIIDKWWENNMSNSNKELTLDYLDENNNIGRLEILDASDLFYYYTTYLEDITLNDFLNQIKQCYL